MEKIKIIEGSVFVDDRGFVYSANDFDFLNVKRFYMIENHERDFIRAWHGHKKESKYAYVVQGTAMFCLIPVDKLEALEEKNNMIRSEDVVKVTLTSKMPGLLYIPAGYANGFMTLEEKTKIMFFSTSTLKESQDDDFRFKWNLYNPWNISYR